MTLINRFSATSLLALGTAFSLLCLLSTPALADGMLNEEQKAAPTALDKALMEVQGETTEEPIPVTKEVKEVPAEEPKPVEEEKPKMAEPKPEPAPAPENRVVEVQPHSSFLGLSVGLYDATHGHQAAAFGIEFQPGMRIAGFLQPIFGATLAHNGAFLAYTGVGVPFHATKNIFVMPSVAAGFYTEGDRGYDLGRHLAFRAGAEFGWKFENKSRIGLNAHVISNGTSLGREDRTEVFSIVYTTPLENLKKGR